MVRAVVTCTKCAKKFQQEFPDNKWGDMLHVICPDGHKSYDVLDQKTLMDSNTITVDELFERPSDDDNRELALT